MTGGVRAALVLLAQHRAGPVLAAQGPELPRLLAGLDDLARQVRGQREAGGPRTSASPGRPPALAGCPP